MKHSIENHLLVLSKREREVYARLFGSMSNRQIAKDLHVTEGAVKFHLTNIYRKIHVKRRSELLGILLEQEFSK